MKLHASRFKFDSRFVHDWLKNTFDARARTSHVITLEDKQGNHACRER